MRFTGQFSLDTPLTTLLRKSSSVPGDLGVEIEWEGSLEVWDEKESLFWTCKEDGSLRNGGIEYILRRPILLSQLPEAMADFKKRTKNCKPVYSSRMSTHIHTNVTTYTIKQIYNIITFHALVERMLIHSQGLDRKGNLFCLGFSDAEGIVEQLLYSIRSGHFFRGFSNEGFKYSALNIAAIFHYGSLEWRFIRGLTDLTEIEDWVRNMVKASKIAASFNSASSIVENYRYNDAEFFLKTFFESDFLKKYIFPQVPLWRQLLKDNFSYAYELANELKKPPKPAFERPFIASSSEDLPTDENLLGSPSLKPFSVKKNMPSIDLEGDVDLEWNNAPST